MNPELIKNLIIAGIAALIFAAGWAVEGWRKDAQIERLERVHADEKARAVQEAAEELQAAVKRGNELAARVTAAEATRDTALQETQHALRKETTGKPCLSGAAVRLLNESAGLKPTVSAVPPGQPARDDAAVATDTDIAQWVAFAIRSYDTCRGRLDAIADFYEEEN